MHPKCYLLVETWEAKWYVAGLTFCAVVQKLSMMQADIGCMHTFEPYTPETIAAVSLNAPHQGFVWPKQGVLDYETHKSLLWMTPDGMYLISLSLQVFSLLFEPILLLLYSQYLNQQILA